MMNSEGNQMMPENNYSNYQMSQNMPSTSNSLGMSNYSMDDPSQNMMQQQCSEDTFSQSHGFQQIHYQNQYGSSNGPPSIQQQMYNNNNFAQSNQQQTGSNSRLNTPSYGGNTPTYPQQLPTPGYASNNGFIPGQPNPNFQNGMMMNTPTYGSAPGSMQPSGNLQEGPVENNGEMQNNLCRPNGMDMNMYQMRMQQSQQMMQQMPRKIFNSEMLNSMSRSNQNPFQWHQIYMQNMQQNALKSNSRKRKLSNSSSPLYNGNGQQPDYNQQAPTNMSDFQMATPVSMSSSPASVHDLNAGTSTSVMNQRSYLKQDMRKDDEDPLRLLEYMANQTIDVNSSKTYAPRNDMKKQEDKKVKLAKLECIANELNLQPDFPPNMMPRMPHPMQMPGGPHMMAMPPGMKSGYFPPNFDPNMVGMRPGMMPPNGMMFAPNPGTMPSPGMHPGQVPGSNVMMFPPQAYTNSPKYMNLGVNRPMMPNDVVRPPMMPDAQNWMQQMRNPQMLKQHEVAAGGNMYMQ